MSATISSMSYSEGDRVELVYTSDEYTKLEPGEKGTVTGTDFIEPPIGPETQVWIEWDNGSMIAMILGEDKIKKVE